MQPKELNPIKITKLNIIKVLEDCYNSIPDQVLDRSLKSKEPKFILNTSQIEKFTKKGYFKNGELTEIGNDNINELLPYLRWDY